jgi:hypothetical protein
VSAIPFTPKTGPRVIIDFCTVAQSDEFPPGSAVFRLEYHEGKLAETLWIGTSYQTRVKQSPLVTHLFYLCINFCESVVVPLADSRKTSPEFASLLNLLCWQVVERTVNWHHLTQSPVDWRVISICWRRRLFRPGQTALEAARTWQADGVRLIDKTGGAQ